MCGIAGFWTPKEPALPGVLRNMTDCLRHRGPDGGGCWIDDGHAVALGHRRLSIVDLSPTGDQPMASASGRFVMVFNGEIYNFRTLRRDLVAGGVAFRGTSDTEVMLALIERAGVRAAVDRLSGMFAFAVWDNAEQRLWLGRDRLGEKPLYYAVTRERCLFGSELKSLVSHPSCERDLDAEALGAVLRYGYVPAPGTIYRSVRKLHPGELLVVSKDAGHGLQWETIRYWHAGEVARNAAKARQPYTLESAADAVEQTLTTVVGEQMLADVPVGAFLSGGIDSSLVVALMQQQASQAVRTFTVAFDEAANDESRFARAVADHLGTQHTEIRLPAGDALGVLASLPDVFDEPFADSSQLPTWLVSKITREHVTVALSGDGGDELFGGYSQHTGRDTIRAGLRRIPRAMRGPLATALSAVPSSGLEAALSQYGGGGWGSASRDRLLRGLRAGDGSLLYEDRQARWIRPQRVLKAEWAEQLPTAIHQDAEWLSELSDAEQAMAYDAQTYLPGDILVKVDRAAMANSLETRAPLLDHRVYELAWSLPLDVKIRGAEGKQVLRTVLGRHVPKPLFDRPKQGFAIPLAQWLRHDLRPWAEELLAWAATPASPISPAALRSVWLDHREGRQDHSERLWSAFVLLQWLRHHH